METDKYQALDTKIILRVATADKKKYKIKAKDLGISLSELVLTLLDGLPPPDREQHKSLYVFLNKLTTEMNHIGNNINQVTRVIHQIKNTETIHGGNHNV